MTTDDLDVLALTYEDYDKIVAERKQVSKKLEEILEQLPPSRDQLAALLEQEGCQGVRGACGSCPMANYFNKKLPGLGPFGVGSYTVFLLDYTNLVDLPGNVRSFVRDFDCGLYPQLEKQP